MKQPRVCIQLGWHQRGEGRHHATHHACRDSPVQRSKQQTPAASARETECSKVSGIDTSCAAEHLERYKIIGEHGASECLPEGTSSLGHCVLVQRRHDIEPFVIARAQPKLLPQGVLRSDQSGELGRWMSQIKLAAAPRERVVHEHDVAPTCQVVGRSPTRVVRSTKPNSTRVSAIAEVDQLLSTNRTDPAMAVQTQHPRQAAAYARRAQQPSGGVGPVTHGPPKPANLNPIQAPTSLIVHGWSTAGLAQAQYPTQCGCRRVRSDVRLSRSYGGRPVLIAGNRVRAVEALLRGVCGQLGTRTSARRTSTRTTQQAHLNKIIKRRTPPSCTVMKAFSTGAR